MTDEQRYSRHMGLFGREGQERISRMRVGIIGLGGLGSHLAQQLAYLGVTRFILIDADVVSVSNLNRLIGAGPNDVGKTKVSIVRSVIQRIQPDSMVQDKDRLFLSPEAPPELLNVDALFGCVDTDATRLQIVQYASRLARPYMDLATDVPPDGEFGGRIVFALDGQRCLSCLKELDQHELARAQMTREQQAADDAIYGIDRDSLEATGPSVVSVNGVVASLAVTEFMVWVTGLREPSGYLNYRGDRGTVGVRSDQDREYCYYCMTLWGTQNQGAQ